MSAKHENKEAVRQEPVPAKEAQVKAVEAKGGAPENYAPPEQVAAERSIGQGAMPADRPLPPNEGRGRVDGKVREQQQALARRNAEMEAANRDAANYAARESVVPSANRELYEASAKDPAAVNNEEAARTPNASDRGGGFVDSDVDEGKLTEATRAELEAGRAAISNRR